MNVAVPDVLDIDVLDIVPCCTTSVRGVSADSDDKAAGNHVSR